jgi:hypothetical protein
MGAKNKWLIFIFEQVQSYGGQPLKKLYDLGGNHPRKMITACRRANREQGI